MEFVKGELFWFDEFLIEYEGYPGRCAWGIGVVGGDYEDLVTKDREYVVHSGIIKVSFLDCEDRDVKLIHCADYSRPFVDTA